MGRRSSRSSLITYYKTGYRGIAPAAVQPMPAGLRMIAGDSKASAPTAGGIAIFNCLAPATGEGPKTVELPTTCPVGNTIWATVTFPQCWDGVHLDSPDHKSHMAYPINGACPADHPVPFPEVTLNFAYTVTDAEALAHWRLASDNYDSSIPAGYSLHADWFNGWKPEIMQILHPQLRPGVAGLLRAPPRQWPDDARSGRLIRALHRRQRSFRSACRRSAGTAARAARRSALRAARSTRASAGRPAHRACPRRYRSDRTSCVEMDRRFRGGAVVDEDLARDDHARRGLLDMEAVAAAIGRLDPARPASRRGPATGEIRGPVERRIEVDRRVDADQERRRGERFLRKVFATQSGPGRVRRAAEVGTFGRPLQLGGRHRVIARPRRCPRRQETNRHRAPRPATADDATSSAPLRAKESKPCRIEAQKGAPI